MKFKSFDTYMQSQPGCHNQASKLLGFLRQKGPNTLNEFIESLRAARLEHVADVVEMACQAT